MQGHNQARHQLKNSTIDYTVQQFEVCISIKASRSTVRDADGSLQKKELICLWNSTLAEPGQLSAQLFKLIRLTAYKKHVIR